MFFFGCNTKKGEQQHADASRQWFSWLFGCKPKTGGGIQNIRYCRFTGHKFYVDITDNPLYLHLIWLILKNFAAST